MAEKKLTALENLKAIATEKLKREDAKLAQHKYLNQVEPIQTNNNVPFSAQDAARRNSSEWNTEYALLKTKTYQKNITVDSETKALLDEMPEINASALFRKAVRDFYNEWRKK